MLPRLAKSHLEGKSLNVAAWSCDRVHVFSLSCFTAAGEYFPFCSTPCSLLRCNLLIVQSLSLWSEKCASTKIKSSRSLSHIHIDCFALWVPSASLPLAPQSVALFLPLQSLCRYQNHISGIRHCNFASLLHFA